MILWQQAQRFLTLSVPLQLNHFTCHQAHKTTAARLPVTFQATHPAPATQCWVPLHRHARAVAKAHCLAD